jgi:hypothetical protein
MTHKRITSSHVGLDYILPFVQIYACTFGIRIQCVYIISCRLVCINENNSGFEVVMAVIILVKEKSILCNCHTSLK